MAHPAIAHRSRAMISPSQMDFSRPIDFSRPNRRAGILPDELPRVLVLKGGNPRSFRVDELGSDRGPQAHTRAGLDAQPSTPSPILATPVPLAPPSPTLTHPHPPSPPSQSSQRGSAPLRVAQPSTRRSNTKATGAFPPATGGRPRRSCPRSACSMGSPRSPLWRSRRSWSRVGSSRSC